MSARYMYIIMITSHSSSDYRSSNHRSKALTTDPMHEAEMHGISGD